MKRNLFGKINITEKVKLDSLSRALLLGIFGGVFITLFMHSDFETNDDNFMAAILYGVYGDYNSHLIFINIVIGKVLKMLLTIFPGVYWYTIFQVVLLMVSFSVIFFVIFKKCGEELYCAYLLNGLLLITFGYECFANMQFSKTAAAAVIAGMVLLFEAVEDLDWREIAAGELLIIIGSMVRYSVFEMSLVIFFGVGIRKLVLTVKSKEYKRIKFYFLLFGLAISSSFLMNKFDKWQYSSNPEWKEYREINTLRAQLLDWGFPDYEKNQNLYTSLGISEEDIEMYKDWDFADTEIFSKENLKLICAAKEKEIIREHTFPEFLEEWLMIFLDYRFFIGFLIILFLWLLSGKKEKVLVGFSVLTVIGIELYLYYKGRYLVRRVDFGVIMAAAVVIAWNVKNMGKKLNREMVAILLGCTVLNALSGIYLQTDSDRKKKDEKQEFYQLMNEDSGHLYLSAEFTHDYNWTAAYPAWELPQKGIMSNYYALGGWTYGMPVTNRILQNYGIENPFGEEIVDNPSVYIVDNNDIEEKVDYIKRHYSESAYPSWAKYINGNWVLRVVTHEPHLDVSKAEAGGEDIYCDMTTYITKNGKLMLDGVVYQENTNSFQQEVYIGLEDLETGETNYYYTNQLEDEEHEDVMNGKYGRFQRDLEISSIDGYKVNIYLVTEKGMYRMEV